MALCFAHSAAGYLVYEAVRPAGAHRLGLLAASVFLAGAPDLDFVPGFVLGRPGAFHRGISHSVLAAVVVGVAVGLGAWLLGRSRRPLGVGLWAGAAYGSHLLVDCITVDAVSPYGLRLLWPLSTAWMIAPVTPLREIVLDGSARSAFLASLVRPENALTWASDAAVLVVAVLGVHLLRRRRAAAAEAIAPSEACST
jgi:inner membrane protein